MMLRTNSRGRDARPPCHEIAVDRVDLEALESFLISDRSPPESMMLSDLDGFLTGIAVGPELVLPSEWLPLIWGGETPEFADEDEAKAILGAIMGRYNEILREIADDELNPVFWADRDGTLIAADWAEGFLQAIMLRTDAWGRLFKSEARQPASVPDPGALRRRGRRVAARPAAGRGRSLMEEAAEFIPASVAAIAAYWRGKPPKANLDATHRRPVPIRPSLGQNRTQRAVPLRLRKKIQKMLRQSGVRIRIMG